jgi:low temperature requirement protein LtrA
VSGAGIGADGSSGRGPASASGRRRVHVPMVGRSPDEEHRSASPLELLFDLTFVVAVSKIAGQLSHRVATGDAVHEIVPFLQVFFAIWWAWMNFTWFASSYDTDDVPYRLLTFVQMAGVLVLAAGVPAAVEHDDYLAITVGYLVMRCALVALWLRAAAQDPAGRSTALRYAGGIALLEVGWILRLVLAETGVLQTGTLLPAFVILVACELAVPVWAERRRPTSWHPHHIAERYALFAIILLGECILGASSKVGDVVGHRGLTAELVAVAGAALVLLFALWWLYFLQPTGEALARNRDRAFRWGYAQYFVFAALAALGAGLEVAIEGTGVIVAASDLAIAYSIAIPVAVFVTSLWVGHLAIDHSSVARPTWMVAAAVTVLLLPLSVRAIGPAGVVAAIAATCVVLVTATVATGARRDVASVPG